MFFYSAGLCFKTIERFHSNMYPTLCNVTQFIYIWKLLFSPPCWRVRTFDSYKPLFFGWVTNRFHVYVTARFLSDVKTLLKARDSDVKLQYIRPSIIKEILCSAVHEFFLTMVSEYLSSVEMLNSYCNKLEVIGRWQLVQYVDNKQSSILFYSM